MDHITGYKARVLVVVDGDSELAHLLRDSEGPAHVSWDPHEQRLKDHWIGGSARVQEVRRAAVLLLQRLVERPDDPTRLDTEVLAAEYWRELWRHEGSTTTRAPALPNLERAAPGRSLLDIGRSHLAAAWHLGWWCRPGHVAGRRQEARAA